MNPIELKKRLDEILVDLMRAANKPANRNGAMQAQEHVLKAYNQISALRKEIEKP